MSADFDRVCKRAREAIAVPAGAPLDAIHFGAAQRALGDGPGDRDSHDSARDVVFDRRRRRLAAFALACSFVFFAAPAAGRVAVPHRSALAHRIVAIALVPYRELETFGRRKTAPNADTKETKVTNQA